MTIPKAWRQAVIRRAKHRCEYCKLAQVGQEATFHVDHIHPIAEGSETTLENLALACVSCSLRKGARRTALDPLNGSMASLFHPRLDVWPDHFIWKGNRVIGTTSTGRATVECLKMNRAVIVAIRKEERIAGRHPPG